MFGFGIFVAFHRLVRNFRTQNTVSSYNPQNARNFPLRTACLTKKHDFKTAAAFAEKDIPSLPPRPSKELARRADDLIPPNLLNTVAWQPVFTYSFQIRPETTNGITNEEQPTPARHTRTQERRGSLTKHMLLHTYARPHPHTLPRKTTRSSHLCDRKLVLGSRPQSAAPTRTQERV